ncbi:MAG TPA: trypsin-like peptidase domain-containing protein, partial [Candidatus Limnocylindrales bacterium]|nr:trypsin-like peptidase domain-containing protein [Candidatus Limnocylindrales bacterium]
GVGSGTILDSKGYILTNSHLVGGAHKINVTLSTNEVLEGTFVGSCAIHDVAVVKVNVSERELQAAEFGDSDKIRVGQRVFAIGNPFGLAGGPSVTSGVISAINRTIESERGLIEDLVQTDASINPGNSGGPLVDVNGKVIAINTAIIPFAQGIGFAVPVNSAKECANQIVTGGAARTPWLGIVGLSLTRELVRYYDLPEPVDHGVLVTKVAGGSPAEAAGMTEGDIILEINDVDINRIEDLVREIRSRQVGEVVKIFAVHGGKEHFFELSLGEAR